MPQAPRHVVGVELSSDHIAAALVREDGALERLTTLALPLEAEAESVVETLVTVIDDLITQAHHQGSRVPGIGIGATGPFDPRQYAQMDQSPLAHYLSTALELPVWVENAVGAMAVAEHRYGAAVDFQHVLYIAIEPGLEGAILFDGQLWRGASVNAGSIGGLVADWAGLYPITLEQRAAGHGIAAQYAIRSRREEPPTLLEIAQAAAEGDELAKRVLKDGARMFGTVIAPVVNFLDPQLLVIGGDVVKIGELWWRPFEKHLRAASLSMPSQVQLTPTHLDEHAVILGAAHLIWQKLNQED